MVYDVMLYTTFMMQLKFYSLIELEKHPPSPILFVHYQMSFFKEIVLMNFSSINFLTYFVSAK